ncbi:MAG: hypothetical protein AB8G05_11815 [Oligoflexales bacterium]
MARSLRKQIETNGSKFLDLKINDLEDNIRTLNKKVSNENPYDDLLQIGNEVVNILHETTYLLDQLDQKKQDKPRVIEVPVFKWNWRVPINFTAVLSLSIFLLSFPFLYAFYYPSGPYTNLFNNYIHSIHKSFISDKLDQTIPEYFNHIDSAYAKSFTFNSNIIGKNQRPKKITFPFYAEEQQAVFVKVSSAVLFGDGTNSGVQISADGVVLETVGANNGKINSKNLSDELSWNHMDESKNNTHNIGITPYINEGANEFEYIVDIIVLVKDVPPKRIK